MATINEVINKLQNLKSKQGKNIPLNIYNSHNKTTHIIDVDQIYFDERKEDIYIGIY